ncbi:MAG: patatin-like phospholipase family protein [bacterium]
MNDKNIMIDLNNVGLKVINLPKYHPEHSEESIIHTVYGLFAFTSHCPVSAQKDSHKAFHLIFHIVLFSILFFIFNSQNTFSQTNNFKLKFKECCGNTENDDNFIDNKNKIYFSDFDNWRPKVAVALSGGGSRGFAQIGVLKALKNEGIPVDYIVGTSIGSVVAGLYAVGYSPSEMDSIIRNTNWDEILSFADESNRSDYFLDQKIIRDRSLVTLRFKNFGFVIPEAISVGNKFNAFLQRLIWNGLYHDNGDFNSLKIPFRAVTTDLISGETKILSSGNLITAIKASSSIPLRYTPVRLDSMVLVDGGLMANIPVKALDEFVPDITIAVNTISPLLKYEELDKPWNIADQVVSILMKKFSDSVQFMADINIEPDLADYKNTDFSNLYSLIYQGETKTMEMMNQIKDKYFFELETRVKKKLSGLLDNVNGIEISGFTEEDSSGLIKTLNRQNFNKYSFVESFIKILIENNYQYISLEKSDITDILKINGQKYLSVKSIRLVDDSVLLEPELEDNVNNLFSSNTLNPDRFIQICEYITRQLRKSGLSFSGISGINFNRETGELLVTIKSTKITSIQIESTGKYDFLIKRELNFKEGKTASADNLIDSWENINSLDFISNVEMQLIGNESDSCLNVVIKTTDIGDQTIRFGMRVDNERFAQLGIDFIQDNIFNQGTRLSLRFTGGLRNQSLILKAENTRIFNTFLTSSYSLVYDNKMRYLYQPKISNNRNRFENERTGDLTEERFAAKLMLGAQIERKGTLSAELRYENFRFWENSDKNIPDFKSFVTLKVGALFDTEDRSDFPSDGSVVDMALESSLFSTADNVSFSKVNFHYHSYYSYGMNTFKPSVQFGFADESTALTEFFNLGGQELFLGMREDESRGRQIAVSSLEYRLKSPYNIFFDTYLSLRYDLGYVWENFETIRLSTLKHGIGSTLGFDTPVGPAKFSLGRSFYFLKNPNAVAWGQVFGYFSIGIKL